ncbi:hypothetical protein Pan54_38710 [Rubinisphaera italica]|uniref:Uncharacterized protein n=1 Tax=Rubinisphaera italica TaxID=2527969 RepID=A0A5C5XKQ5_9PLAN|nr:hypothetical protein Pan54_38710 [Rubinisphaera italica]
MPYGHPTAGERESIALRMRVALPWKSLVSQIGLAQRNPTITPNPPLRQASRVSGDPGWLTSLVR